MSASCKPRVQLFVDAGNGWPHSALQYHLLMPISCHFRDRQNAFGYEFVSCKKRYSKSWLSFNELTNAKAVTHYSEHRLTASVAYMTLALLAHSAVRQN